jgi:hypothetical protein
MPMPLSQAEQELTLQLSRLEVEEILALCYAFTSKNHRMLLYMNALRQKGGERSQFAACLICFDLARQGNESLQKEFTYLAGTVRDVSTNNEVVQQLLGTDPYLEFVWGMLKVQLDNMDQRFENEHSVASPHLISTADISNIDLISDADFNDEVEGFDISGDPQRVFETYQEALDRFLGKDPFMPAFHPSAGFRLNNRKDAERLEQFLLELDSLRDISPPARAMRSLVLLFYGTHIRSKNFFGTINERKQFLLREGLREFRQSGKEIWEASSTIQPMHAKTIAWEKILEVLTDYVYWCSKENHRIEAIEKYDAVGRQITRDKRHGHHRRSTRDARAAL